MFVGSWDVKLMFTGMGEMVYVVDHCSGWVTSLGIYSLGLLSVRQALYPTELIWVGRRSDDTAGEEWVSQCECGR